MWLYSTCITCSNITIKRTEAHVKATLESGKTTRLLQQALKDFKNDFHRKTKESTHIEHLSLFTK